MSDNRTPEEKARRAQRSAQAVAAGMCGNCIVRPQVLGLTRCQVCTDKNRQRIRKRQTDPVARSKYNAENNARRKATRAEYIKGQSCVRCGSTDSLELDHIDPSTKVSSDIWNWRKDKRDAEYAKCQWLCATCHRAKTAVDCGYPPGGRQHGNYKKYLREGCRCDECRAAYRERESERKARRIARGLPARNRPTKKPKNGVSVMVDTTARDALARNLCARICNSQRTHDELRVFDFILERIEGHGSPMDLAKDIRNWQSEAAEECADLIAYLAMARVAQEHRRRERVNQFIDAFDDEPTTQFRVVAVSEPSSEASAFAAPDSSPSSGSPQALDGSDCSPSSRTHPESGAALSLEVGGETVLVPPFCEDCNAPVDLGHADGCAWTTIVPGKEGSAA